MNHSVRQNSVPRWTLWALAALLGLSLLLIGGGRITGVGTLHMSTSAPAESRDLFFEDRQDGAVVVYDADGGGVVDVLAPGTNGFVRGVMRGLARERMLHEIGSEVPFGLVRGTDNRLTLTDRATGRVIDLGAFGPTNTAAFARLLKDGEATP